MSSTRTMTPNQKKHVASLRALLGSANLLDVQQGIDLLASLQDPEVLALFDDDSEITERVRAAFRDFVKLSVLTISDRAPTISEIRFDNLVAPVDLSPLVALQRCVLQFMGTEPVLLRGHPQLTQVYVTSDGDVALEELHALVEAKISRRSGPHTPRLRLAGVPALRKLTLSYIHAVDAPALPALAEAVVSYCDDDVARALATQPALATLTLEWGKLDQWSGAPALTSLNGSWRNGADAVFPALTTLKGAGPVPRGAPNLTTITTRNQDVRCEDLPALTTLEMTDHPSSIVLKNLPALRDVKSPWGAKPTWGNPRLRTVVLEHVGGVTAIDLGSVVQHVVLRGIPDLSSLTAMNVPDVLELEGLPALSMKRMRAARSIVVRGLPTPRTLMVTAPSITIDDVANLETLELDASAPLHAAPSVDASPSTPVPVAFPTITRAPMLHTLTCRGPIPELRGLDALTTLTSLTLEATALPPQPDGSTTPPPQRDLSPLARLTRLASLTLRAFSQDDLTPLTGLVGIKTLALRGFKGSSLGPLASLAQLRELALADLGDADLTPLAALNELETLTVEGLGTVALQPLAGLPRLRTLTAKGTHPDVVTVARSLPALATLDTKMRFTAADFRALLDHPTLTQVTPYLLIPRCFPGTLGPTVLREAFKDAIAILERAERIERHPLPPARKDRAALTEARRILTENEPRRLLPMFKAEGGVDLARALCEGTYVGVYGTIEIGKVLTNATRVGIRGDTALLVADAAGLLDGIEMLDLAGLGADDLGVLRRHARTLKHLDGKHGDEVTRRLDAATPLEGDPTEPLIGPPAVDRVPLLLGSRIEAEVLEGVALSLAQGRAAEVLAGCKVASAESVRAGATWRTTPSELSRRAVFMLLGSLPAGDPTAAAVLASLTSLRLPRGAAHDWIRHASAVADLRVSLTDLPSVARTLPAPTTVTKLHLEDGAGDLAPLHALPALAELTLVGDALQLGGLGGHPALRDLRIEGPDGALDTTDLTVLARLPALRTLTTRLRFDVGPLARAMGERPIVLNGVAPQGGITVLVA